MTIRPSSNVSYFHFTRTDGLRTRLQRRQYGFHGVVKRTILRRWENSIRVRPHTRPLSTISSAAKRCRQIAFGYGRIKRPRQTEIVRKCNARTTRLRFATNTGDTERRSVYFENVRVKRNSFSFAAYRLVQQHWRPFLRAAVRSVAVRRIQFSRLGTRAPKWFLSACRFLLAEITITNPFPPSSSVFETTDISFSCTRTKFFFDINNNNNNRLRSSEIKASSCRLRWASETTGTRRTRISRPSMFGSVFP